MKTKKTTNKGNTMLKNTKIDFVSARDGKLELSSYEMGVRKLVIITGKGIHSDNEKIPYVSKVFGKLKYSVPDYIRKKSELMSKINNIEDADIEDGGSGAFYINLKKKL